MTFELVREGRWRDWRLWLLLVLVVGAGWLFGPVYVYSQRHAGQ